MAIVMKASDFVDKLYDVVNNHKTLYVMGCFGAPMTPSNKERYTKNHEFNKRWYRTPMIRAASADTFGFDCVCLLKGILWGWAGDEDHVYGGAKYASNGVPDVSADGMINLCKNVTTDFSNIEVGEAVWCKGHIGVYVGNGLSIECTPSWKNNVQITAVQNIAYKKGYNNRTWTKHGKLPYIEYDVKSDSTPKPAPEPTPTPKPTAPKEKYTLKEFIRDVQGACGAAVDGIAGPETISKTVTLSAHKNSRHAAVKFVQQRLYELGYVEVGEADGIAGPKFTSAILHFQQDNSCVMDGEITAGNKTWKKLLGMI